MASHRVKLRVQAHFGDREIDLSFPANWEVTETRMAGHDKPALTDEQILAAVRNPIGAPRLSELARGKQKVVILFDDLPKPTPTHRMVPAVLEELHAGGIRDDQIRFLCGPGTHRPMIYREFTAKLGAEIVARYPVYNHHNYEHLVNVGTTSRGTPVLVNQEYASCDLRVAIGSIIPHQGAGYGGGGKIILPGISGMETVRYHHTHWRKGPEAVTIGLGKIDGNVFRLDIEEAARLADLQFKVDSILNNRREVIGVFAGDFVAEHRAGVKMAREVYHTELLPDCDVVVSNAYPDECQFSRACWPVPASLKDGGDFVLVTHPHAGEVAHQWAGRWGSDYGGGGWTAGHRAKNLIKAARVLVMSPFLSMFDKLELGGVEKVVHCRDWGEVLAELSSRNGPGTKVGVYPYAPLQLDINKI